MDKEDRKLRNDHFIKAFEYVARAKGMNQTKLADAIGSKTAYISKFKKYIRPVPEETIDALICISATIDGGDGQIYKPYLLGDSDYMLLRNVPDDEIIEVERRRDNPDYEVMNKQHNHHKSEEPIPAWADSLITLVSNNTAVIELLRRDNATLLQEIAELREVVNSLRSSLISSHHPVIYDEKTSDLPMAAEKI